MMFASSAVYRNDSFTKLVGSDFFNTLSHKRKFGCRELSKTTSSCRDPAIEPNASAGSSRSGRLPYTLGNVFVVPHSNKTVRSLSNSPNKW